MDPSEGVSGRELPEKRNTSLRTWNFISSTNPPGRAPAAGSLAKLSGFFLLRDDGLETRDNSFELAGETAEIFAGKLQPCIFIAPQPVP